jgi:RimJ/RimL family protein N-acetyltransferase
MILQGDRLQLKTLTPAMVTQKYVNWMNDPDVTKYTESRFRKHTMESVTDYVKAVSGSSEDYFYGIYTGEHIGNIKLHVDAHHNLGDIGIIIGDKQQWGKGYATEAIKILTQHGFDKIGLHKISAGIYANNTGSVKAFKAAGYTQDGMHERTYLSGGDYVDEIIVSKWSEEL